MNLLCKIFGHKIPNGWGGGKPYFRASGGYTDGVGREHWKLSCRCDRCNETFHVGNVHGPLDPNNKF